MIYYYYLPAIMVRHVRINLIAIFCILPSTWGTSFATSFRSLVCYRNKEKKKKKKRNEYCGKKKFITRRTRKPS